MKTILLIFCIILMSLLTTAQQKPTSYCYVVMFNSECCGVPDVTPLTNQIISFKKKNKVKKISYFLVSPMGKEGEYYMAFPLSELNKKQKILFIKELNETTFKMKDKGSATTQQNMTIDKTTLSSRTTITKKMI